MRRILGVLRQRDHAGELLEPQPGVDQIYRLIERAREHGQQVELTIAASPERCPLASTSGSTESSKRRWPAFVRIRRRRTGIALSFEEEDLELQLSTTYRGAHDWPTDTMRQRVLLCGGELSSEPHETDGARLTARLPRGLQGVLA